MPQTSCPAPEPDLALNELRVALRHFDTAMLVTQRDGELRSRPMVIVDRTPQGHVWFISSMASGKLNEMKAHPRVNVAMQRGSRYLSISGNVRVTRDAYHLDQVWRPQHSVWFPQGRADADLVLVEVVPLYAEYWDRSSAEGMKLAFAMAMSLVTGDPLDDDVAVHGKLPFPDRHLPGE